MKIFLIILLSLPILAWLWIAVQDFYWEIRFPGSPRQREAQAYLAARKREQRKHPTRKELPYRDDDRIVIWKWINENCRDKEGDEISKAVNDRFFAGEAKQEWLDDILSGRNTPFQKETKGLWKAKRKKEKAIQEALSTVTRMAKQSSKNQL